MLNEKKSPGKKVQVKVPNTRGKKFSEKCTEIYFFYSSTVVLRILVCIMYKMLVHIIYLLYTIISIITHIF